MDCLTEEQTIQFTDQMLEALGALHASNIVHLDVKVEDLVVHGVGLKLLL